MIHILFVQAQGPRGSVSRFSLFPSPYRLVYHEATENADSYRPFRFELIGPRDSTIP